MVSLLALAVTGSSPRVRGRLDHERVLEPARGLIPACAGQTRAAPAARPPRRAHPRVCGADGLEDDSAVTDTGSSPRVRGRPRSRSMLKLSPGLIPACAGQTRRPRVGLIGSRAHPRVCGADLSAINDAPHKRGSSPRVRGRPSDWIAFSSWRGLIPACAGQTRRPIRSRTQPRAHPRVCGADGDKIPVEIWGKGSSPRVRGRRHCWGGVFVMVGLIPACAGQTVAEVVADHPRLGSSPRVRGRLCLLGPYQAPFGLIPACAGQTHAWRRRRICCRAHPRVCGADATPELAAAVDKGSSPRVRGRRIYQKPTTRAERLIPACAGQTGTRDPPSRSSGAHPRVCGADSANGCRPLPPTGSSPRVRGRPSSFGVSVQ